MRKRLGIGHRAECADADRGEDRRFGIRVITHMHLHHPSRASSKRPGQGTIIIRSTASCSKGLRHVIQAPVSTLASQSRVRRRQQVVLHSCSRIGIISPWERQCAYSANCPIYSQPPCGPSPTHKHAVVAGVERFGEQAYSEARFRQHDAPDVVDANRPVGHWERAKEAIRRIVFHLAAMPLAEPSKSVTGALGLQAGHCDRSDDYAGASDKRPLNCRAHPATFGHVPRRILGISWAPARSGREDQLQLFDFLGAPKGIRTPVFAVKGRRPRPLDDGRTMSPTASTKRGDL